MNEPDQQQGSRSTKSPLSGIGTTHRSSLLSMVLLLLLYVPIQSDASAPKAIAVAENHGFVNIDLPIDEVKENAGVITIRVLGTQNSELIGFDIDFPKNGARPALPNPLKIGMARIRSTGPESDRFVGFLSRRYGVKHAARRMVRFVDASAAGLGTDQIGKKEMKFFFFADGPEDRYAELYINIDFEHHIVEFHEKDPDYRAALILALTKAP